MTGAGVLLADPRVVTTGACSLAFLYMGHLPALRGVLARPAVVWFGRISYSVYLLHWPIGRAVMGAGTRFLPPTVAAGMLVYVAAVSVTVAVAWVMYRFFERPALALSQWLKPQAAPQCSSHSQSSPVCPVPPIVEDDRRVRIDGSADTVARAPSE